MENHPIPQDVTGFQFKLIGNMTIKQFAYLATGVVLAWVVYASPISGFIKLPLAFVFAFFGFILAFIPVEGRPADVIILHFIKALFSPNQYIFQRQNAQFTHMHHVSASTNASVWQVPQAPPPVKEGVPPPPEQPVEELQPQVQEVTQEAQPQEQATNMQYQILQQDLEQALQEKAVIEKELLGLRQMFTQQAVPKPIPPAPPPAPEIQATKPIVKTVSVKPASKTAGLPTPDSPNILIGIIRDARGNILPNMLVEVKDKDGNPVRAFKTNQLGQFASATPLLNGVYTLEFEDPQGAQKFNALELTMVGEIIGPIEVTSIDTREELRKALFANN